MSNTSQISSFSAVSLLTEGIQLPLPRLHPKHIQIIVSGILRAWNDISNTEKENESEVNLNFLLEFHLNNQDGPIRSIIINAVRGKESPNHDASSLECRPDISLYLHGEVYNRNHPLTIECKILDKNSKKGIDLYCKNGILRYIEGSYGWARNEGLMIAYVRDGSSINATLSPYLNKHKSMKSDPYKTITLPIISKNHAKSLHQRNYKQRTTKKTSNACNISLFHIWLNIDN